MGRKLTPFFLFAALLVFWAAYMESDVAQSGGRLTELAVKTICWGIVPAVFASYEGKKASVKWVVPPREFFRAPFPWLPCVVALCLTTAFLYTVRIQNGLVNMHVIFDWYGIATSVCAGVVEEYFFRAYLFGRTEPIFGFWPAALLNGALFTLFHYPVQLLNGSFSELFSPRGILIFVMGAVFCGMFQKWRCITLCMVVHTFWDIISFFFCIG